jgi:LysM repeat protein
LKAKYKGRTLRVAHLFFGTLIGASSASAEIIRCPDWESLAAADHSAVVRASTSSSENFDATLARTRATLDAATGAPLDGANLRSQSGAVTTTALPASCTYTVRPSDTLSRIAAAQLGDAARYPEIISLNRATLRDPDVLTVGSTLSLPCSGPSAAAAQGDAAAPSASSAPVPAPIPVWTARKGDTFTSTIQKWGQTAGYTVVVETTEQWQFDVDVSEQGSFRDVLGRVVRGLGAQGVPPVVQVFSNNVIKIGL